MEIAAQLRCLLEGLTGVRDAILCSSDGRPLESIGVAINVAEAAVITASIANELSRVGEMLALGTFDKVVVRGPQANRVMAKKEDTIVGVSLEPRRSTVEVETRLASNDWSSSKTPSKPGPVVSDVQAAGQTPEPPPAPREPVFAGQLELFCLPDLLEFLRAGQRTGKLRLDSAAGAGVVRMRRGRITAASSPNVGTLGDYLVRHAVITGEQLRALLQDQRQDPARKSLGRLSIDRQLATAAEVRRALVAQVQDAVRELKNWVSGQFAFEPEPTPEPSLSDIELELDPQAVMLTIYAEEDEARRDVGG
jgi:predicted regulator of Ras-like GTPase activity (Roadblock/LC7/MglB family)